MKILMVSLFDVNSCGPTEVIKKIVPELIGQGNTVSIFSPYCYNDQKEKLAKELNIKYYYCHSRLLSVNIVKQCVDDIDEYDIVHMHGVFEPRNWWLSNIFQKMGIRYVLTIHGNLMKNALKKSWFKKKIAICLFVKKMLRGADCIHALSQREMNDIKRIIVDANILVIPNGIDCIQKINHINNDDIIHLLYIGRIDVVHKGLDLLFSAITIMNDSDLERLSINIVGPFETKKDRTYVNQIMNNPKIQKVIHICGAAYGNDKIDYYKSCDYFIHTSRYEGMPMAVLEALSYGVPCIVTDDTNVGDILEASTSGKVIKCDKLAIANTMCNLKKNTYHVDSKWIEHNLLWKTISKNYIMMYKSSKGSQL